METIDQLIKVSKYIKLADNGCCQVYENLSINKSHDQIFTLRRREHHSGTNSSPLLI